MQLNLADHYRQHIQAADQLSPTYMAKNIISAPLPIASDISYIVASYLTIDGDLSVDGNLLIIG